MVTAGAGSIPECLTSQLAGNGVMIVPVGERMSQKLMYIKKDKKGRLSYENKGGVVFVEFKGLYGFNP
jgi:protein-L-isoaspartate(D-aspartate) O-methyltransferase